MNGRNKPSCRCAPSLRFSPLESRPSAGQGDVVGDLRSLIWSDIPNNRMLRWEEETGAVSAFRKP
jgi:sugar lactone lactonase YvrE